MVRGSFYFSLPSLLISYRLDFYNNLSWKNVKHWSVFASFLTWAADATLSASLWLTTYHPSCIGIDAIFVIFNPTFYRKIMCSHVWGIDGGNLWGCVRLELQCDFSLESSAKKSSESVAPPWTVKCQRSVLPLRTGQLLSRVFCFSLPHCLVWTLSRFWTFSSALPHILIFILPPTIFVVLLPFCTLG